MRKTCAHGHSLSGDNVLITAKGGRRCRTCKDADVYGRPRPLKTHCSRGHDMTRPDARYRSGRGRRSSKCKVCAKIAAAERWQREKAVRAAEREAAKEARLAGAALQEHAPPPAISIAEAHARFLDETPLDHWGLDWKLDDRAWYVVACHPQGLTLEEIGSLMGVTRERVRQIEEEAFAKIRKRTRWSLTDAQIIALLREADSERDRRTVAYPESAA